MFNENKMVGTTGIEPVTPSMSTRTSPPKTARNRDCYQPLDDDSGGYVTGTLRVCTQIAPKCPNHVHGVRGRNDIAHALRQHGIIL